MRTGTAVSGALIYRLKTWVFYKYTSAAYFPTPQDLEIDLAGDLVVAGVEISQSRPA